MDLGLNIQYSNLVTSIATKPNTEKKETPKIDPLKSALKTVCATYNHEINNALAPIMMMAQMYAEQSDDPEIKDALEIINNSAKKIKVITKELYNQAHSNKDLNTTEYVNYAGNADSFMIDLHRVA